MSQPIPQQPDLWNPASCHDEDVVPLYMVHLCCQGALEAVAAGARSRRRGALPKGKGSMAALDQAVVAAGAVVAVMQGDSASSRHKPAVACSSSAWSWLALWHVVRIMLASRSDSAKGTASACLFVRLTRLLSQLMPVPYRRSLGGQHGSCRAVPGCTGHHGSGAGFGSGPPARPEGLPALPGRAAASHDAGARSLICCAGPDRVASSIWLLRQDLGLGTCVLLACKLVSRGLAPRGVGLVCMSACLCLCWDSYRLWCSCACVLLLLVVTRHSPRCSHVQMHGLYAALRQGPMLTGQAASSLHCAGLSCMCFTSR